MYNENKPKYAFVSSSKNFVKNWPKKMKPKKKIKPARNGKVIIWKEK